MRGDFLKRICRKGEAKMRGTYIVYSLVFILMPPAIILLLGVLAQSQTVDTASATLSHLLFPMTCAGFLATCIGWGAFLRPPLTIIDGKKAGILSIFLCYLFCSLPLAISLGSWDGFMGIAIYYFLFFLIFQIATFWVTYPIGMAFGRLIVRKMSESLTR